VENSNIANNSPEAVSFDLASLILKQFALDTIFSPDVVEAHNHGSVHIHDLNFPHRLYCGSHSIEYLKKYGLKGLCNLSTTSKPARSASVLTGHLNTFLASMQAYYAGALGLGYINVFYAPYLVGMSEKEVKQIAQELIFNGSQNAFSRGGQTLFLDFNVHTGVPSYLANVPAIGPGGKYMFREADGNVVDLEEARIDDDWCLVYKKDGNNYAVLREHDGKQAFQYEELNLGKVLTYSDFDKEVKQMCKALLDVWDEGDAFGHVFEFPKLDFHVSAETFTDPEQYALFMRACEVTSHNGSTYFIFDRDSVSLASCCRLRVTITDMSLLLHPESLRTSFPRNDIIVIRRNGGPVEVTSFGRLYDETESPVIHENAFEIKELVGVEVWDKSGWTGLQRVMRHKKTPETRSDKLLAIKVDDGQLITVTENHPLIVSDTDRRRVCPKCGSVSILPRSFSEYKQRIWYCPDCRKYTVMGLEGVVPGTQRIIEASDLTTDNAFELCPDVSIEHVKKLDSREAYLLGAYVGDGSMYTGHKTICISKPEEHPTTQKVLQYARSLTSANVTWSSGSSRFPTSICPEALKVGHSAYIKQLPPDYMSWTVDTFGAVFSGLIDTDGYTHKNEIVLVSTSKVLVSQIQMYLRSIGIPSRMRLHAEDPCINNELNGGTGHNSTHLAYALTVINDKIIRSLLSESIKVQAAHVSVKGGGKLHAYGRASGIRKCTDKCETYVYDITTDSHTFVANGVLQHNCGFGNVTINLPQCAYKAKHALDERKGEGDVFQLLLTEVDRIMDIAAKAHMQKKEFLSSIMVPGAPMWQIAKPANDGKPYMRLEDCVYIIGMIGLNDALEYLYGKQLHESDEMMELGLKLITHMFMRAKEYTKKYGVQFKLEESPAESAARRLAKTDLVYWRDDALKVFKGGTEDAAYYTNSIHLAANAPVDIVERIRKQSMYHSVIESGAIIHAFIGEEQPEPGAVADLVTKIWLNTQCAQITFSPEFTYCLACGSVQRGLKEDCNACGSKDVVGETRVVGYFSRIQNWTKSKRYGELVDRHKGQYNIMQAGGEDEKA